MKTKLIKYYCAITAAAGFSASSAFATIVGSGQLTISAPGLSSGDANGPYSVTTTSVSSGPNLGSFRTFCLGSQVDYYSGHSYSYVISTAVQPFASGASGGLGYITSGTAWLYSQYLTGAIGDGAANDAVNDAIQAAIWYLQGHQVGGQNNSYVALAESNVGPNYLADANGEWGVYALDLSPGDAPGDSYGYAQPQLCQIPEQPRIPPTPVPEPSTVIAGCLALIPLGLSGMRFLRKKLAA